jgi:hypothetical protein
LCQFDAVRLGAQEVQLRKRLLKGDPVGPGDYPFFGLALRDPATNGFQDKLVKAPDAARHASHWVYTLLFGGVLWHYYISKHAGAGTVPVVFARNGLLTLGVQDWMSNAFVQDAAGRMHNLR